MVITPPQRPTLLLLEFQHAASLRIDLQYIQHPRNINKSESRAVTIDANDQRQGFPEQFALLGNMRQGKPPQKAALPANNKQMLGDGSRTDDVLRLLGIIELVDVIDLVDVWFVIDEPTDFSSHFAVAGLRGLEHGQPWRLALVLPHVDVVLGTCDYVGFGHGVDWHLQGDLLALDCCADGIAQVDLGVLLLRVGEDCAEFALAFDLAQLFHVFHVFLVGFCVPENHAEFHSVGFLVGEHQGAVWEVTPFVVGSDGCAVDGWASCNCDSESVSFPSNVVDGFRIGNPQIFEVVAFAIKKLDNSPLLLILQGAASNRDDGAGRVPLDLAEYHGSINGNRVLVFIIFHEDESALLVGDAESNWGFIGVHLGLVEPVDAGQRDVGGQEVFGLYDALQSLQPDLMQQLPSFIVHEDLAQRGADKQLFRTGRPAHHGYFVAVLLAPLAVALHPTYDHVAVFVGDAHFAAVWTPFQVFYHRDLAVVYHLLDPLSVVFHEDDDSSCGVAGGKFAVLAVPNDMGDASGVVGQVGTLIALGTVALHLQVLEFD